MSKFVFKDDVQLNINGEEFSFDSTDIELIKGLEKFANESQEYADSLSKRTDYVEALKEATQYSLDAIDSFLGEGSSKKIFKDEKVSLIKAMNVINYISDETKKARSESMNKYSPNRATRRVK